MTYRKTKSQKLTAKSQSKKETRHKYIKFIRVSAKLKNVLFVLLSEKGNQQLAKGLTHTTAILSPGLMSS